MIFSHQFQIHFPQNFQARISYYTLRTYRSRACTTKHFRMLSPTAHTPKAHKESLTPKDKVTYDGIQYQIVREGFAEILTPQNKKAPQSKAQAVFYNPIQQFNRDLSVLAIRAFGDDFAVKRKSKLNKKCSVTDKKDPRGLKRKRGDRAVNMKGENGIASQYSEGGDNCNEEKLSDSEDADESDEISHGVKLTSPEDAKNVDLLKDSKSKTLRLNDTLHDRVDTDSHGLELHLSVTKYSANSNDEEHSRNPTEESKSNIKLSDNAYPQNCNRPRAQVSPFRILDALSATGLRALRYAKEIPMTTSITANDLSPQATASIRLNVKHNEVNDKIHAITGDARTHMHNVSSPSKRSDSILYEVIDLDPYGTAVPFLDAAINAVVDGGLLCVTCTDAGVFASVGYVEKTYSQYGGLSLKGPHAHEGGIRLILHSIATTAARYGRSIEPLLSLSIDFYVRVFVRIRYSPAEVKFLASKTMTVYSCDEGCGAWSTQYHGETCSKSSKTGNPTQKFGLPQAPSASQYCDHCGFKTHLSGPMWGGPLHNPQFIQRILDILPSVHGDTYGTLPRVEGMLTLALSEPLFDSPPFPDLSSRPVPPVDPGLRDNHPFFFVPSVLAKVIHCVGPSDAAIRGALMHLGYRVSRSHTKPGSISTDAPWSVIWEVMREWVRQKSKIKEDAIKPGTAGWGIMAKDRSKKEFNAVKDGLCEKLKKCDDLQSTQDIVEAALSEIRKAGQDTKTGDIKHKGEVATDLTSSNSMKIIFDEFLGRQRTGKRLVKYQMNPRADWGPMNRARGG